MCACVLFPGWSEGPLTNRCLRNAKSFGHHPPHDASSSESHAKLRSADHQDVQYDRSGRLLGSISIADKLTSRPLLLESDHDSAV